MGSIPEVGRGSRIPDANRLFAIRVPVPRHDLIGMVLNARGAVGVDSCHGPCSVAPMSGEIDRFNNRWLLRHPLPDKRQRAECG